MSADEYIAAVHTAIAKLKRIIEREGDMGGARNEPWYLEMLIQEQLRERNAQHDLDGRRIYGVFTTDRANHGKAQTPQIQRQTHEWVCQ